MRNRSRLIIDSGFPLWQDEGEAPYKLIVWSEKAVIAAGGSLHKLLGEVGDDLLARIFLASQVAVVPRAEAEARRLAGHGQFRHSGLLLAAF